MKDWAGEIFGGFIGVLTSIVVFLFARAYNRKREELEMHNKYLDTLNKLEEFKRVKQAELESEAEGLKETMREMALRYKENLDQLLFQLQERSEIILKNTQTISQLRSELEMLKKQVNGN